MRRAAARRAACRAPPRIRSAAPRHSHPHHPPILLPAPSCARSVRRILDKYARFIRLGEADTARLVHSLGLFRLEHERQLAQEEADRAARQALRDGAMP